MFLEEISGNKYRIIRNFDEELKIIERLPINIQQIWDTKGYGFEEIHEEEILLDIIQLAKHHCNIE